MSTAPVRARFRSGTPRPQLLNAYVGAVVLAGIALLAFGVPKMQFTHPVLFVCLLLGSMMAAVMKIHLPLSSGQATLSMSYFTDFLSLVISCVGMSRVTS